MVDLECEDSVGYLTLARIFGKSVTEIKVDVDEKRLSLWALVGST